MSTGDNSNQQHTRCRANDSRSPPSPSVPSLPPLSITTVNENVVDSGTVHKQSRVQTPGNPPSPDSPDDGADSDDSDWNDEYSETGEIEELESTITAPFVMYSPRVDSEMVLQALQNSQGGIGQLESDDDSSPNPSPRPQGWQRTRGDSTSSNDASGGQPAKLRLKGFLYQLTSFHQPKTSVNMAEKGNTSEDVRMKRHNSASIAAKGHARDERTMIRSSTMYHSSSLSPSAIGPWVKRYFALTLDTIYVFATPFDRKALHFVECASIYRVERLPRLYKRREHAFAVRTYGRTYMLSAESEAGMEKWINAVRASIRDCATESINHSFRHLLNAFNGDNQPFVETVLRKVLNTVPGWDSKKMATDITRMLQYMVNKDKKDQEQQQQQQRQQQQNDEEYVEERVQSWEISFNAIKLGKKIAEGFFGEVFKGAAWGKTCAIKRLKLSNSASDADANSKLIKKLKQEAALMSELRHPNVLLFIGLCTDPNNTLLVMEFASGGSLYDVLQNNHIDDATFFRMITDICLGMNYLHQRNILHLDLKPLNLLADDHFNIKVSDFGISRLLKSKEENVNGPTGYGTVLYMADELIYGPSYGKSADVFSFGVTLFELLWIREHPETNFAMEDSVGFNLLREPISKKQKPVVPAWWPDIFKTLVEECCSDDPSVRPSFDSIISSYLPQIHATAEDWWLARHNSRRIRELAEDITNHSALTNFDIWHIMNNYLMQTKDEEVHWNIFVAMIELAMDNTEQNPAILLNDVIERLEALVENQQTLVRLQEVISDQGEFRHFCKLIESDFVVALSKERVLAIILRLIENEKVVKLFVEQGIVTYFSNKFSNRLKLQSPSSPQKQQHSRKRNRSFVVTGIQVDFADKLLELPIAQILQRLTSTDNEEQLQKVVDDGGIDVLVFLSTEDGVNSDNYETVFVALQTLAELSIKDSKLATIIEGKGVKPVQLATRAYLGALLRSSKGNFVNVKSATNSDIEHNAFTRPNLREEGEQVLPYMRHSFHKAREHFNSILDRGSSSLQTADSSSGTRNSTTKLRISAHRRSHSSGRLSSPVRRKPQPSGRSNFTSFTTLTEILGQNTGSVGDEVIAKLWEMLNEESDLDNIDCTKLRQQLEDHFKCVLEQRKQFVEQQISQVIGQMDTPSLITNFLFLGSEWNSTNLTELKRLGIGYIVNVGAECPCYYPQHFVYAKVKSSKTSELRKHFDEVFSFIDKAREQRSRVLVHSHFGVSRSATFVIAYLMVTNKWSLLKAYKYVRDIRPIAQPHRDYMRQLMEFEYELSGQTSLGLQSLDNGNSASRGNSADLSPRSALDMSASFNHVDSGFIPHGSLMD